MSHFNITISQNLKKKYYLIYQFLDIFLIILFLSYTFVKITVITLHIFNENLVI